MGERVSSDDLAALLFRERCFILDGLITFSCERVADAVILLPLLISPRAVGGQTCLPLFFVFLQTSPERILRKRRVLFFPFIFRNVCRLT